MSQCSQCEVFNQVRESGELSDVDWHEQTDRQKCRQTGSQIAEWKQESAAETTIHAMDKAQKLNGSLRSHPTAVSPAQLWTLCRLVIISSLSVLCAQLQVKAIEILFFCFSTVCVLYSITYLI